MLLGPLSNAFASLTYAPIPRGCIELPTAYGEHVWGLMKGRPTKYIKRVPKPGGGFRYFYDAGHGGGVHAQEHMVEGARFRHGEGHFHVVKSEGDTLHVRNSATGEEHTITKQALSKKLAEHHAEGIKAYRDRASKALAEAKANKASPKQIARLEERVKRAGGAKPAEPAPKENPKPTGKRPTKHEARLAALSQKMQAEWAEAKAAKDKPAPESKPDSGPANQVKSMRTSQIEGAANNPRHPMHEAAKAELERREKSVTPQQAIEIARKALAIERRQADGAGAGRRASSTQADEAATEAFAALTSKQSKAAMDALHGEDKAGAGKPADALKAHDQAKARQVEAAMEHKRLSQEFDRTPQKKRTREMSEKLDVAWQAKRAADDAEEKAYGAAYGKNA